MQGYSTSASKEQLPSRSLFSNILVSVLGIGLLFAAFRLVQSRLTSVSSVDAVINAAIININAPQEGIVSDLQVSTGEAVTSEKPLLALKNPKVAELQTQQIQSVIAQRESELQNAKARLAQLITLAPSVAGDWQTQSRLEATEIQQSIEQVNADLEGARAQLRLAQLNYDRANSLRNQGAVSTADRDRAATEVAQRQAEVRSLQRRIAQLQTNQTAALSGVSINRTNSNYDPRIRLQELQMQIAEQRKQVQLLEQQLRNAKAELATAQKDRQRQQSIAINVPKEGVVYQLPIQSGEMVQQGELLVQVLDCSQRWVDAFVDERSLRSIEPGTPATIHLYGDDSKVLRGKVSMIRSGVGRIDVGHEIAKPTTSDMPREAQVRVVLESDDQQIDAARFCYVGHTGKVTFDIR